MRFKSISVAIVVLTSILTLAGRDSITYNGVIFNGPQWDSTRDINSHPNREDILKDLIEHYKIKALTYHQLIDSLGEPANYVDPKDSIYYDIVVNYGYLDPKSGKYLAIGFNKDSIATGFKVVEWHNRHVNE